MRKIIHIDMDCFFAAVEMLDNPSLRRVPLAVAGASRRSVVCACNYRAREFGVRSATPLFKALELCPGLTVVSPRFERYSEMSRRIRAIFRRYTDLVEPLSLDEAYLDVTARPEPGAEIAAAIRADIRKELGLAASAGVAPNKLLAKIASDWNKPDGQFEAREEDIADFMRELPVRKIWGVGPKAEERLKRLGCLACGDLQRLSRDVLLAEFGRFGLELHQLCRGVDDREVNPVRIRKSMSVESTYADLVDDEAALVERVGELRGELLADLKAREGLLEAVTGVFVKVKFSDFKVTTLSRSGRSLDEGRFREMASEAFRRQPLPARLLGVGVRFGEADRVGRQLELWPPEESLALR